MSTSSEVLPIRDCLVMAKPTGPQCNLGCKYCYYLGKDQLFPADTPRKMSDELLERYIAERIATAVGSKVHFEWHGGEPTTLGLPYFRRIVELQRRHHRPGFSVSNGLQTNGTLLDADWARFLSETNFSVGLSLDGPAEMHDAYRVNKGGYPTHRQVVKAFQLLQKRKIHTDVLCVVHAANVGKPKEVYRYFKDLGVRYLQFLPLVEREGEGVSDRTPAPEAVGEFLCTVFDEWVQSDVGRIVIQFFDEALRPACGVPHSLCLFRETCGDVLALEHDGSMYPCDHFVDPQYRLGNLEADSFFELLSRPELAEFGDRTRSTLPSSCLNCEVLAWCNGGCPKDRIAVSAKGEPGLNYLCKGFQRFFRHCQPAMDELAERWRAGKPGFTTH